MNEQVVDRLDNHEKRITELEKNYYETKNGMLRMENTLLQQGKEQKDLINKLIDHFFDDRKDARNNKVKLSEIKWTTLVGLFGGGSVIVLVVQWLLSLI